MSDFEEQEYWVHHQQRFEAALAFTVVKDCDGVFNTFEKAVQKADALIAHLEKTRTKK